MSAIESVLRAVEQITDRAPKRVGEDRWMALCPAHDDRNPSLSIREARGKALVHCFAGCSTEAVLEALRLRWTDLFEADR
jgi:putative DNA primase/helicase